MFYGKSQASMIFLNSVQNSFIYYSRKFLSYIYTSQKTFKHLTHDNPSKVLIKFKFTSQLQNL